jgi:hypothetical protein
MGYLAGVFALANALLPQLKRKPEGWVSFLRFYPLSLHMPRPCLQWFTKLHLLSTPHFQNTHLLLIHHITTFSKISIKSCNPVSKSIQKNDCCEEGLFACILVIFNKLQQKKVISIMK